MIKKAFHKKQRKLVRAAAICIIALLIGGFSASGLNGKSIGEVVDYVVYLIGAQQGKTHDMAEVMRIVDGDTIVVLIDGHEQKVRLIGIDTPESTGQYKNNPQPGGEEAAAFMDELLPDGSKVYLTSDVGDVDKYGRLLRYVWLETPDDARAKEIMVNCILLDKGYAALMTVPPNVEYVELFETISDGVQWYF